MIITGFLLKLHEEAEERARADGRSLYGNLPNSKRRKIDGVKKTFEKVQKKQQLIGLLHGQGISVFVVCVAGELSQAVVGVGFMSVQCDGKTASASTNHLLL